MDEMKTKTGLESIDAEDQNENEAAAMPADVYEELIDASANEAEPVDAMDSEEEADSSPSEMLDPVEISSNIDNEEGRIGNLDVFSRGKQSVQLQGRNKSRTYSNRDIIPLDDDGVLKVETRADIRKKEFNELNASMRADKIMKGYVSSVTYSQSSNFWYLSIIYGDWFKVIIPLHRLVPGKSLEDIRAMSMQEQRLHGNLYLGAEIDYQVIKVDEVNTVAVGDRITAMEARRRRLFSPNSNSTIESGMVMEARVVSVAQHYINVEFHGIETAVRVNDIAYYRIPDLRKVYKNGQRVVIMIKELEADITKRQVPVKVSVSIKEAQPDPRVENIKKLTENQSCEGEVTLINQNGVYVLLKDLKMEVLSKLPKFTEPIQAGDHVVVRITTIDEEELHVYGTIVWKC